MLIFEGQIYGEYQFLEEFQEYNQGYLAAISTVLNRWYDDKEYIELTSSGSTAEAKTIRLQKSSIRASALRTQKYFHYEAGDNALLCLPVKFIGGMMMLIRSIVSNLNLHIAQPSLNPLIGLTTQLDFVPMTPAQLISSLDHDPNATHNIKSILLGGGSVNSTLLNKIQDIDSTVFHSYGMTETISHIAIRQLNHTQNEQTFRTISGISIHSNVDSCLEITSDYFEGIIKTNDIVELVDHNEFIWKGRKDNVINTGGIKVYPEIVEQKIDKIINNSFYIVGSSHGLLGEQVCLVIESDTVIDHELIQNQLVDLIDKFELPQEIYCTPEFLRTPTGKIRRKDTLEMIIKKKHISR